MINNHINTTVYIYYAPPVAGHKTASVAQLVEHSAVNRKV